VDEDLALSSPAWVEENREVPPSVVDEDLALSSPAWTDYHDVLQLAVNTWLVGGTVGPMREITSLREGALPPVRLPPPGNHVGAAGVFRVGYNAVQKWSRDPIVFCGVYPAMLEERYESLVDAISAAVEVVSRILSREIEEEHEDLPLDELDEIFPVGGDVAQVVQWDRAEDPDGTVRVRAVYVNRYENVKVTAWVERE
jgi:hypothetical protein